MKMSALYILWLRELLRFLRSPAQIIAALGQPVIYLLTMGFGMEDVFRQAGRGSYLQFIVPGLLAMTVVFSATFSGFALLWDRQFGFLKETLVAPVPRVFIMLGRTCGVATVALLQAALVAVVCLIAGFRPVSLVLLPAGIAFLALIALVFAGFGTIVGSSLKDGQAFPIIINFLVMPLFLLSGALFPLDHLPSVLTVLTRLNPLSYGVDGLRSTLIAQSHFAVALNATVLISLALALIGLGAWRFSKIEV
jgi:ABC-2 type transport system permease protein